MNAPQEFHEFEVDKNIISSLIFKQNGTLSTALRELVMNCMDYGAKTIHITILEDRFEVSDDGEGFEDEESIMRNFKRFGTQHLEGDAKFGRFRIGRGQIMAFAKCSWHSKNFEMSTDTSTGTLGFNFVRNKAYFVGCNVSGSFYEALRPYQVSNLIRDLSELIKYAEIPVFINASLANNTESVRWDYEDDQINIRFDPPATHGIALYSQGVKVKDLHLHRYGRSADVVTKKALILNMARNEINETDPLWIHVHKTLTELLLKEKKNSARLSEYERQSIIYQLADGDVDLSAVIKLPLLKDCRGKTSSIFTEMIKKRPWSICPSEQPIAGDRISTSGAAFVLDSNELSLWGQPDGASFLQFLSGLARQSCKNYAVGPIEQIRWVHFEDVLKGFDDSVSLIASKDLNSLQQAQRNTLQYAADTMAKRLASRSKDDSNFKRKVFIGEGASLAWTDSATYIAIEKSQLKFFDNGLSGLIQLALMLLHEFTHREGSVSDNGHDMAFYESFHDSLFTQAIKDDILGNAVTSLKTKYATELESKQLPFPKWLSGQENPPTVLNLKSEKPSDFLLFFLSFTGLALKKRKGAIEINLSWASRSDLKKITGRRIDDAVRKAGIKCPKREDFAHISDFNKMRESLIGVRRIAIQSFLDTQKFTLSDGAVDWLTLFSYYGFEGHEVHGGLERLTQLPEFEVRSVQSRVTRQALNVACKELQTQYVAPPWKLRDFDVSHLSEGGKEARFSFMKDKLESLISEITDPAERSEFLTRFFNEPTQALFGSVKE